MVLLRFQASFREKLPYFSVNKPVRLTEREKLHLVVIQSVNLLQT